ncbi:arsenate reductase (glutaredoxin) [Skermania sp. ID1734]|uniref:arsenate reductase (glutaredoxin) n=1 Tax=Skermania sp. ID1734 TaxID=2597516 RepID=UPI00117DDFD8|nr:arsenate reductase (glutaredoxin) [Skermania sp. ID1734]TSD99735.1 arsenate reductase (glutaredoxin) [Skermania sp. ID1734]
MANTSDRDATIYHNPRCNTSRTVLRMIEESGIAPTVVKYLETPPSRDALAKLLDDAGLRPSEAIRRKEPIFAELGLADADEETLLAAMVANPILIERPIVVTGKGTRLARPAERVNDIL